MKTLSAGPGELNGSEPSGVWFRMGGAAHHGTAPTPITTYVSMASKTASFALLLRLFQYVFTISRIEWIYLVAGVAVASLTWGNLAALTQTNIKRLLAYSSISHVGYILLGVVGAFSAADAPELADARIPLRMEPGEESPVPLFGLQPVIARPRESGGYELVVGERRWRAARRHSGVIAQPGYPRLVGIAQTILYGCDQR